MASAGGTPKSNGRRKSLDAEINLVPFIDLLSMCICFLLMTAVWMELGGVNIKQYFGTEAPQDKKDTYEMDLRYVSADALDVSFKRGGQTSQTFKISATANESRLLQLRSAVLGLAGLSAGSSTAATKQKLADMVSVARITTKAGVSYGEIVSVMDTLRDLGISSLGLVPVKD